MSYFKSINSASTVQFAAVLAATLPALMPVQSAFAAESGTYEAIGSFMTNYTKVEQGGHTITGGPLSGTTTITKSSAGLFAEGSSSVTDCIVFAKKSDAGLDLEAPCTNTYPAGDKVFYVSKRKLGDLNPGGGGEGKQEILGGSGKYSGITGSCTFKTEYLPGNHGVSHQKCQWQKP